MLQYLCAFSGQTQLRPSILLYFKICYIHVAKFLSFPSMKCPPIFSFFSAMLYIKVCEEVFKSKKPRHCVTLILSISRVKINYNYYLKHQFIAI